MLGLDVSSRYAMSRIAFDLRRAARALVKAPLFTSVAVVSLGLALALNTTMFALADAVVHPYVPYPEPDRNAVPTFRGGDPKAWVPLDLRFAAVRDGVHGYDRIAAFKMLRAVMVQTGTKSEYEGAAGISPEFFDVLGVRPMVGRLFGPSNGGSQAAVISFRLWNRLFNGRPLSDTLTIDVAHARYTIVGVMPRSVHFPYDNTDIWLPLDALPADPSVRSYGPIPVLHLRPGVTRKAVSNELMLVARRLSAEYTPDHPLYSNMIGGEVGVGGWFVGQSMYPPFIFGTVVMVLIIACANLGTMMIARGTARRRETAIRIAVGAARRDIIREVLCECLLLGLLGLTLGILLCWWALYILPHFTIPWVPTLGDLQPVPSWRVFAFALGASLATILSAGALPAWRAASTDPAEPMKEGSASTTGRLRGYNPLIIIEAALSTALLMCSALFLIVVVRYAAFNFRYAAKQLVTADLTPGIKPAEVSRFYDDLIAAVAHLPHARSAATHGGGTAEGGVIIAEEDKAGDTWMNSNVYEIVSADYFRTMGISVLRGRDFVVGDARGAMPIAIVDENAAARLWPDIRNPVGRMLKLGRKESNAPWIRVVGVAQAIQYAPPREFDLAPDPMVYVLVPNDGTQSRQLIVRGDGVDADHGRALLSLAVQKVIETRMQGSISVRPWLDHYENTRDATAFMASLFGAFAGFGLVLCAVGLYGVLAYTVTRRLREFAVRVALGARRRDVIRLVVHDAAVTALAGIGIGAFVALWFTRPIIDSLDVVSVPYAPVVALVASESLLFVVAFVASLGPVRRAAQADPLEVIRAI
ncbi:MAG TPA: ABC transporter permease [Gemmatimonadaceae bacterium]